LTWHKQQKKQTATRNTKTHNFKCNMYTDDVSQIADMC